MAKTVVGIDLGASSIRAAEVRNAGRPDAVIVRAGEIELPPGAVRAGDVIEVNSVADALKRLWAKTGFKSKEVVLGVGNHKVISRDLAVPALPIARMREPRACRSPRRACCSTSRR